MLLKAIGQPLGTLKGHRQCPKAVEYLWAILKGCWKVAGNAQITPISHEKRRQNSPVAIGKNSNFRHFSCVYVYIYQKLKELWKIFQMLSSSSTIFALSNCSRHDGLGTASQPREMEDV
jgi:hypothetical protein